MTKLHFFDKHTAGFRRAATSANRAALATLMVVLWTTAGRAVPVTNFFSLKASPATTLSGTGSTDDPSLGTTGTTGSAARMIGYFPEQTLTNVGDAITLSFSVSFADATTAMSNGTDNFRFALFDRNGETEEATNSNLAVVGNANTNDFLGYWFGVDTQTGTTGAQGSIRERSITTEIDPFTNNSTAANLSPQNGDEVTFALGDTYTGVMTLTLTAANEITLSGSFTDPTIRGDYDGDDVVDSRDYLVWRMDPTGTGGDPLGYDVWASEYGRGTGNVFSFVETTPITKKFSVVGFLNGGPLSADQANFQNIDVTFTPAPVDGTGAAQGSAVPEPTHWVLAAIAGFILVGCARSPRRQYARVIG